MVGFGVHYQGGSEVGCVWKGILLMLEDFVCFQQKVTRDDLVPLGPIRLAV